MNIVRRKRFVSGLLLVCLIAVAVHTAPAAPLTAASVSSPATAAAVGLGFWNKLACVGCIAGFLVGAGTTVAGLAIFLQLNPELAVLCFSACDSLLT